VYDVIVLGAGGAGSAALYHLARRGARVVGIERFAPPHDRGSSHGQTRIIRQAYFEHPDYVPLLRRSYALWRELEQHTGRKLYFATGLLEVGPHDGVVIPGVLQSARRHGLEVETLSDDEARRRFPGFRIPPGCEAVFERDAGYLLVEDCVRTHAEEAQRLGAELRIGESIRAWRVENGSVVVETDRGKYRSAKLVISPGAWATTLLADLGIPLRVVRKHLHWFANDDVRLRADRGCPAFFYETPQGYYYGFPQFNESGVKAAEHSGGDTVTDPLAVDRSLDAAELNRVQAFLADHLPGVSRRSTAHVVCMYTMTPDEHFLVGMHPQHPQVVLVAGLSGHGFKFTPVLGEILAQLALDGQTPHPIEFLSPGRMEPSPADA
jgi:monomeric sarcosine oxidase